MPAHALRSFRRRILSALVLHLLLGAGLAVGMCADVAAQGPPSSGTGARRFRLNADSTIAGVRCGPTGRASVVLYADGALDECPLARDTTIHGLRLPRGTWIKLHPDRRLDGAWLPHDVTLQGVPCKGSGYKGWSVRFHESGALKLCYLAREATIDGVRCRRAGFVTELSGNTAVTLDRNGRLAGCRRRE